MRKILALLVLLLPLTSLCATFYRSNLLFQQLEISEAIADSGYYLSVEDGQSVLFLDGKPVRSRTQTKLNEGLTIVTEKDLKEGTETQKVYENGILISESDGRITQSYIYVNGKLSGYTLINEEDTEQVLFFLRNGSNGDLVGVRLNDKLRLLSDEYIFDGGSLYEIISGKLVVQGDYEVLSDGMISITDKNLTSVYDAEGRMYSTTDGKTETRYFYEGLILLRKETVSGSERKVEAFENGKAVSLTSYGGDEIESILTYNEGGNVKTLFKNGKIIATVYYSSDNRTIERIEYR